MHGKEFLESTYENVTSGKTSKPHSRKWQLLDIHLLSWFYRSAVEEMSAFFQNCALLPIPKNSSKTNNSHNSNNEVKKSKGKSAERTLSTVQSEITRAKLKGVSESTSPAPEPKEGKCQGKKECVNKMLKTY